ncbi:nitroreductase family protein [Falsiroseomonas sp. CW058]|uniref:nitroreductase family protein n=1 Tax=Falsiroseomonas sp. CW058 TaxID=3388664 RepID=UPI003D318A0E
MTDRAAPADHPIHDLLRARWSPRSFTGAPITAAEAASLFEAARWAASCNNDQPWHFLAARRDADPDGFARLLGLLTPNNQGWAQRAAMLVVCVFRTRFLANGNPNAVAMYDLGAAATQLCLQATAMGLAAHQMRGFDVERARAELGVPADHEPASCIAVGHPGPASLLPEALAAREVQPRTRRAQAEFLHGAAWGAAAG